MNATHAPRSDREPPAGRRRAAARRAGCARLLAAVALVAGHAGSALAQADTAATPPAAATQAPYRWLPYAQWFPAGPCIAYGFCGPGGWWPDRPPPRRPVAPEPPPAADPDIWSTTGSPWGYVRRLPPPTPADRIQPRYRDASTIRPEFAERAASAP